LVEKIEPLVKKGLLIAYDKKDWVPRNGHRITRASQRPAVLGLSGPHDDIIFDMDNVSAFEGSQPAFLDSDADIDGKMDRKSYNSPSCRIRINCLRRPLPEQYCPCTRR